MYVPRGFELMSLKSASASGLFELTSMKVSALGLLLAAGHVSARFHSAGILVDGFGARATFALTGLCGTNTKEDRSHVH